MTMGEGRLFATAYCLTDEDLEQIEVAPIPVKQNKITKEELARPETIIIENNDHVEPIIITNKRKAGVKKHGRHKSIIQHNAPVQTTVHATGLRDRHQASVQS